MLRIWIVALLLNSSAFANTLSKTELIGSWHTKDSQFSTKRQRLHIDENFNGSWELHFDSGEVSVQTFTAESLSFFDDFVLITQEHKESEQMFKFVLSGWNNGAKSLFGMVYLYVKEDKKYRLFNGIPINFSEGKGKFITPHMRLIFSKRPNALIQLENEMLLQLLEETNDIKNEEIDVVYNANKNFLILFKPNDYGRPEYRVLYSGDRSEAESGLASLKKEMETGIRQLKEELLKAN